MKLTAIILAGGKSSRMGTDKGLVLLNGKPMIKHVIEAVEKTEIENVMLISNNLAYKQFGLPVYADMIKNKGPLGGIYTGLSNTSTLRNLILSCDIPFVNEDIINILIHDESKSPISVVKYKEITHHLIGVFHASIVDDLYTEIVNDNLKVGQFIQSKNATVIDLETQLPDMKSQGVANINTRDELKKLER